MDDRSSGSYQWLVTATRRDTPVGWKAHAVPGDASETLGALRRRPAACGLRARHGWDIDLFIDSEGDDDKCKRCRRARGMKTTNRYGAP